MEFLIGFLCCLVILETIVIVKAYKIYTANLNLLLDKVKEHEMMKKLISEIKNQLEFNKANQIIKR